MWFPAWIFILFNFSWPLLLYGNLKKSKLFLYFAKLESFQRLIPLIHVKTACYKCALVWWSVYVLNYYKMSLTAERTNCMWLTIIISFHFHHIIIIFIDRPSQLTNFSSVFIINFRSLSSWRQKTNFKFRWVPYRRIYCIIFGFC